MRLMRLFPRKVRTFFWNAVETVQYPARTCCIWKTERNTSPRFRKYKKA